MKLWNVYINKMIDLLLFRGFYLIVFNTLNLETAFQAVFNLWKQMIVLRFCLIIILFLEARL